MSKNLETIPVSQSKSAQRVPNLINHLTNGQELLITKQCQDIQAYCNGNGLCMGERFILFRDGEKLGYLDFYDKEDEIWYAGKTQDQGFVRMIYTKNKREDNWNINFP